MGLRSIDVTRSPLVAEYVWYGRENNSSIHFDGYSFSIAQSTNNQFRLEVACLANFAWVLRTRLYDPVLRRIDHIQRGGIPISYLERVHCTEIC
jgi:hypothetical protein